MKVKLMALAHFPSPIPVSCHGWVKQVYIVGSKIAASRENCKCRWEDMNSSLWTFGVMLNQSVLFSLFPLLKKMLDCCPFSFLEFRIFSLLCRVYSQQADDDLWTLLPLLEIIWIVHQSQTPIDSNKNAIQEPFHTREKKEKEKRRVLMVCF